MASAGRHGERIAPLLGGALLVLMLHGCGDGYPEHDLPFDQPAAGLDAAAMVERLNRMNAESLTATRWSFRLEGGCELLLRGRSADRPQRTIRVQLLHGDLQVKGNLGGPAYAVQVDFRGTPEPLDEPLFEAERWTDAVEYATQLQNLQRLCARRGVVEPPR